jgi:hypothetical protein
MKKLWFKRKSYGWGWSPATWQGWLAIVVYLILVTALSFNINETAPAQEIAITFIIPMIILTIILIGIAYITGEKPKWQWGEKKE